ncbi:MAG: energy-coupling factor transporter ATPase [Chloroflexi bacterium HGW-Chloroflexi-3]|nr:MAG: energy-coupling factor transporter ATPase [Chloroflexi bacterium HGW-Chloroflexi-3]
MAILIEVNQVSYSHPVPGGPPHPALREISFQINEGEHIAIVGANGSGKTTLARHLNALFVPDSGTVRIMGLDTKERTNHLKIHQRIGMVFQSPQEQMIATSIEEDVAFGPENLGLPTQEIQQRVRHSLELVEMWDQRTRSPQHLSAGQMQRVALAGILAMQPACVIFDESTAMLDPFGREDVLRNIETLKKSGITILMITHFMEEASLANRIIGLHQGRLRFDGSPEELFTNDKLVKSMNLDKPRVLWFAQQLTPWIPTIKSPLTVEQFKKQIEPRPSTQFFVPFEDHYFFRNTQDSLVIGNHISFTYLQNTPLAHQALEDISFTIREGSVHGLIGATGSGKSTLLQHLNGLYIPQTGDLKVGPFEVNQETDLLQLRRYTGMVFQNPNYQLFEQYVGDEIAYGLKVLGITGSELRERVKLAMSQVGLDFEEFKDRMTFALSGGEKRKVALASTLVLDPSLMLLDEPTAGLDPIARREILGQMVRVHNEGKTLVVSSHQLEDLALLTDHVTLLSEGKAVCNQETEKILSDHTLLHQYQMIAPIAAQMASVLHEKGWMVPENIIIGQQLVAAFQTLGEPNG